MQTGGPQAKPGPVYNLLVLSQPHALHCHSQIGQDTPSYCLDWPINT